jgi:hypothetical protein
MKFTNEDMTTEGSTIKLPPVYLRVGLTHAEYTALHLLMKKKIPRPEVCQFCFKIPPHQMANIHEVYNDDEIHWRWLCQSCHQVWDIEHGFRPPPRIL